MKPLKATEISYIIEAQIRGVSVSEVLNKNPQELSVNKTQQTVEILDDLKPVKPAPKKRAKKIKE